MCKKNSDLQFSKLPPDTAVLFPQYAVVDNEIYYRASGVQIPNISFYDLAIEESIADSLLIHRIFSVADLVNLPSDRFLLLIKDIGAVPSVLLQCVQHYFESFLLSEPQCLIENIGAETQESRESGKSCMKAGSFPVPSFLPGEEPPHIKVMLRDFFDKLDGVYPDKIVVNLWSQHKSLAKTLSLLYQALNYLSGADMLKAYGYTVKKAASDNRQDQLKEGVSSQNQESNREAPEADMVVPVREPRGTRTDFEQQNKNNPDCVENSPAVKSLQSERTERSGLGAAKADSVLGELKNRYPDGFQGSIKDLIAQNEDLDLSRYFASIRSAKGTPKQLLLNEGLLIPYTYSKTQEDALHGAVDKKNIKSKQHNEFSQYDIVFPNISVVDEVIVEIATGKVIPDVRIDDLGFPNTILNGLLRWGFRSGLLTNGALMLSSLLQISLSETKKFPTGTWKKIFNTVQDYLANSFHDSVHEGDSIPLIKEDESLGEPESVQQVNLIPTDADALVLAAGYGVVSGAIIRGGEQLVIKDGKIEALGLSQRSYNSLRVNGISRISQLIGLPYEEFRGFRNLGNKSSFEIIEKLDCYLNAPENSLKEDFGLRASGTMAEMSEVLGKYRIEIQKEMLKEKINVFFSDSLFKRVSLQEISSQLNISDMPQFEEVVRSMVDSREFACEDGYLFKKYRIEILKETLKEKINTFFSDSPFKPVSLQEISSQLNISDMPQFEEVVGSIVDSREFACEDGFLFKKYPSFYQKMEEFCVKDSDTRRAEVVRRRAEGMRLDELGQIYGLTRERIRQMESRLFQSVTKKWPSFFDEDQFAELYQRYDIEKELLLILVKNSLPTAYYLRTRYTPGSLSVESALSDASISIEIRKTIESWIYRNHLRIDGRLIPAERTELELVVLRKFFPDGVDVDDFFTQYDLFVSSLPISEERLNKLLVGDEKRRSRENKLSKSKYILSSQNRYIRYYDVNSGDYETLLGVLNLSQYKNVELSTLKFFSAYPELMKQYDIRNEYELHNLLKKVLEEQNRWNVEFSKMPTLRFGSFDRDEYVREKLFALAPISAEDLGIHISEELGFSAMFVRNWFHCIDEYFYQGQYAVDYVPLPQEKLAVLRAELSEDFYFFDEIKEIYHKLFPDADLSDISSYNMKRMGFDLNGTYAYRNYDSAASYFKHLYCSSDVVNASLFHERFCRLTLYSQIRSELEGEYEIVEFEPQQYINIRRLERLGIGKDRLKAFCDEVYSFVAKDTHFTMEYIKHNGFVSSLDDLGFGPLFYASLLKADPRFSNRRLGKNMMFYSGDCNVSIGSFVLEYVKNVQSIDLDELVDVFHDEYNVVLDKWKIIEQCENSELYYDRIMEKIYANYDVYFEEI